MRRENSSEKVALQNATNFSACPTGNYLPEKLFQKRFFKNPTKRFSFFFDLDKKRWFERK